VLVAAAAAAAPYFLFLGQEASGFFLLSFDRNFYVFSSLVLPLARQEFFCFLSCPL